MPSAPLRILHLEDNEVDAALAAAMLEAEGLACEILRVDTRHEFESALATSRFDLILSDFSLPSYDGHAALDFARQNAADTPVVFFSGTLGEEAAIEALRNGATDYVLKQRPARLAPAVRRALTEVGERTARRRAEEQFRAAVEGATAGVVMVNRDGLILLVNKQAEVEFGYDRADLLGQPIETLIPLLFRNRPEGAREAYFAAPTRRAIGQGHALRGLRKDGTEFPIEVGLSPVETSDEMLVMASIIDITERKQLEEQFRQAQKMEAVGQLTGGVAHDFNNLLTVINGYAEMTLNALAPDSPLRGDIEQIHSAGQSAAALTRQLLAFSRKQILEPRVVDLTALVSNLDKMIRRMIREDITVVHSLGDRLGCVRADPAQLDQVILNLVVNARDAMPHGGTITITTANVELGPGLTGEAASRRYVAFAVSDTGTGMTPETQRHMFEPFFTTKGLGKGTGLGLATVYGIVQQSNGVITVASEVGKGSTFTVSFPEVADAPEPLVSAAPARPRRRGSETVLLVEDDAPLRALARSILQSAGYRVLSAGNRDAALTLAQEHHGVIQLMLTDVVMPGMSEPSLVGMLAASRPQMKTVYMSGYPDETITRRGVLVEGLTFLQKPFTADALLAKISEALGRGDGGPAA